MKLKIVLFLAITIWVISVTMLLSPPTTAQPVSSVVNRHYQIVDANTAAAPGSTLTLTRESFDCIFKNMDATNKINLKFNGSSTIYALDPLESYSTSGGPIPTDIISVNYAAAAGTPRLKLICWELE